jgi:hypothetical protein
MPLERAPEHEKINQDAHAYRCTATGEVRLLPARDLVVGKTPGECWESGYVVVPPPHEA